MIEKEIYFSKGKINIFSENKKKKKIILEVHF
jgi:hypothetical protein